MKPNDKQDTIKQSGFDQFLERPRQGSPTLADYIGGSEFDAKLDEILFNRMIKLKDLREKPQGNDLGKIYWDGENSKFKLWIGTGGWADVIYTSTSTSSSTSTTSTSSSTSSTSTSSTSTSSTSSSTSTTL